MRHRTTLFSARTPNDALLSIYLYICFVFLEVPYLNLAVSFINCKTVLWTVLQFIKDTA